MGLDMYLYAQRRFDPESDKAKAIIAAAGVTLDELKRRENNEDGYEPLHYLAMWDWYSDEEKQRAQAALTEANLLQFLTTETPSGYVGYVNGELVVQINCAYWRKANSVHAWFVDTVQGGIDDCDEYPVEGEQLALLRSKCLDALTAYNDGDLVKAEEIMTPRQGFFFGGYEIDEWWARDMAETVEQLERVINLAAQFPVVTFLYHSSW